MDKSSMIQVMIIGNIGGLEHVYDGQTIKTRIVIHELEKVFGKDRVKCIDTYKWKKNPFKLLYNTIKSVYNSKNIIFMTDQGGIKVFPWLLVCTNLFFYRKLHYIVIGGWLVAFLKKHRIIAYFLKKMDNIFVETSIMKSGLQDLGFNNVSLMKNFKNLEVLSESQLVYSNEEVYSFCTFSRVMKEKGIEDAVLAIKGINANYGRKICTLDIYGAVDEKQIEWFENLSAQFSEGIRYCGVVPYDKSVNVIKGYYMLLFPTHFTTEGIPGTIIDAYAAGVPVIASRWNGFNDVIDNEVTGMGYQCLNNECLQAAIEDAIKSPNKIKEMKKNCLKKATQYLPHNAISVLLDKLS